MKKRILITLFILFLTLLPTPAFAATDLSVNFHVAPNTPLFSTANMAPGGSETRIITIKNNSSESKMVAIKAKKFHTTTEIASAFTISIYDGTKTIYGPAKISTFFTQSLDVTGIQLLRLSGGQQKDLSIVVTFQSTAGNELQNKSLSFDLDLGTTIELPSQCHGMNIEHEILGTDKRDVLMGTSGNDLIVGKEGNDYIDGKGGDDCIVAGDGNDIVVAGTGNDIVTGGEGLDILLGNDGDDILIDIQKSDVIFGGGGKDKCSASPFVFQCENSI